MAKYYRTQTQAGVDTTDWHSIKQAVKNTKNAVIAVFTEDEALSYRQIKWFKGILLPALERYTGDTVSYWETHLKLMVMPDEFQPAPFEYEGEVHFRIPSITKLTTKKMTQFMEGCVEYLRGRGFEYITMPDSSLRKG